MKTDQLDLDRIEGRIGFKAELERAIRPLEAHALD